MRSCPSSCGTACKLWRESFLLFAIFELDFQGKSQGTGYFFKESSKAVFRAFKGFLKGSHRCSASGK